MEPPASVFISYRHEPAMLALAGRIYDWLLPRFGVFMDHDIGEGAEFGKVIEAALSSCDLQLVLIGPGWADALARRLEDPKDWVRYEIEAALERKIPVVPILVDGAHAPSREALPAALRPLLDRQAFELRVHSFKTDMPRIVEQVGEIVAAANAVEAPAGRRTVRDLPPRAPRFTGRERELEAIAGHLQSGAVVALTGLGGVGKSQLALEYAHRHADDYDRIYWVTAAEGTLVRDLAEIARALDLPEAKGAEPLAAEAARRALEWRGGWLLIVDDAADAKLVRPRLPQGTAGGHVLITSRHAAWRGCGEVVEVKPLAPEDAVALLQRRSGREDIADAAAARRLAHQLGWLPLALEQAAAYMEETEEPFAKLSALLEERGPELRVHSPTSGTPTEHIWTLSFLSFEQLEAQAPVAADLLTLVAFLAPDGIPCDLLTGGALPASLAQLSDPLAFNDAIRALKRYSLVTRDGDALAVHGLVQDVTRDRLVGQEARHAWVEAAVGRLDAAFPASVDEIADPQQWQLCARLLPHVLVAAGHAEETEVARAVAAGLLRRGGSYLEKRGDDIAARKQQLRALALVEAEYGPDRLEVAYVLDAIGFLLLTQGDPAAAQGHLERALEINLQQLEVGDPDVARTRNALGWALRDQGDLAAAREHFDEALQVTRASRLGAEDLQVASIRNNRGRVRRDLGDLPGARRDHERALNIKIERKGPRHPDVAATLDLLARVRHDQGDLADARELLERARDIKDDVLGPDHDDLGRTCWWLGAVLADLGDLDGCTAHLERARVLYERALRAHKAAFGDNDPTVAFRVNKLAAVLHAGDLAGAEAAYVSGLRLDESRYGPEHPIVGRDLNNLGAVRHGRTDTDGAEAAYVRALSILAPAAGAEHPFGVTVRHNLAALRRGQNAGRVGGLTLDVS